MDNSVQCGCGKWWQPDKNESSVTTPDVDDKNRVRVEFLSDRQLLEEIVLWQRQTGDSLEALVASMRSNPMMKMLLKG